MSSEIEWEALNRAYALHPSAKKDDLVQQLRARLAEVEKERDDAKAHAINERQMALNAFKHIEGGGDPAIIGHPRGSQFGDALGAALHRYTAQLDTAKGAAAGLRGTVDRIMVAGNSIASALIGMLGTGEGFPSYDTSFDTAREIIDDSDLYDIWLTWAVIMRERDLLATPGPTLSEIKAEALEDLADRNDEAISKMTSPRVAAQVLRAEAARLRGGGK